MTKQRTQINTLEHLLQQRRVDAKTAEKHGIRNLRQQVYFLRQRGYRIINEDKQTYRMIS